jgi:hypothetical protein
VIDRSTTQDTPSGSVALYKVAILSGTSVAETILASAHVRAHQQAGHMDASDPIKALQTSCKEGAVHIWRLARYGEQLDCNRAEPMPELAR